LPDLNLINNVCIENNIRLIEDNAESMLSTYNNNIYGLVGDISSFSFQSTKHITGFEGGICLTNSHDYALSLRRYSAVGYSTLSANKTHVDKNIIQNPDFERHLHIGTNSRLSNASASIVLSQLQNIHHLVNVRKYCAEMYSEICLKHTNICIIQKDLPNNFSSFWGFAFILIDKEKWMCFRKSFIEKGGLPFYAAWKNNSDEPAFTPSKGGYEIEKRLGEKNYKSYCDLYQNRNVVNAKWIQERMIILRTNLWDTSAVELQCRILDDALSSVAD
jgi:perosamine synthetase